MARISARRGASLSTSLLLIWFVIASPSLNNVPGSAKLEEKRSGLLAKGRDGRYRGLVAQSRESVVVFVVKEDHIRRTEFLPLDEEDRSMVYLYSNTKLIFFVFPSLPKSLVGMQ